MDDLDFPLIINAFYLLAAVLFFLGLKQLGSPATARNGNRIAALGMLIAVVVTLLNREIVNFEIIVAGVIVGAAIGTVFARSIQMTAMPQLVAIFNGFGGAGSAVVAAAEFYRLSQAGNDVPVDVSVTIMLGTLIGLVTFSGSVIAFAKLQELVGGRPITFPLQKTVSSIVFVAIVALIVFLVVEADLNAYYGLVAICLLLGVLLVIPIGGADMPVVISLLNSYSGIAAAMAGFALGNVMLIIAGSLVGAAGLILTQIMIKAMNRSLTNVLFGAFGAQTSGGTAVGTIGDRAVREATAEDAAVAMAYSQTAILVPGYGLAVARAQHQLKELGELLEARGVDVRYAIHPVAGRMPGHMNVLLAEADVPYDKLFALEEINDRFSETEFVLVVGANDVVNPAARDEQDSPIYGMPILEVDKSRQVLVLKRSMNPGFAGLDNELFYKDNTMMLFGDAQASLVKLIAEIKEL
jgi:NAD(P) transhydrogenase subunit beta